MEAFEARIGNTLDYPKKSKSHLLFDWADRLVRHPRLLDAVEDLIGPNIVVYHSLCGSRTQERLNTHSGIRPVRISFLNRNCM